MFRTLSSIFVRNQTKPSFKMNRVISSVNQPKISANLRTCWHAQGIAPIVRVFRNCQRRRWDLNSLRPITHQRAHTCHTCRIDNIKLTWDVKKQHDKAPLACHTVREAVLPVVDPPKKVLQRDMSPRQVRCSTDRVMQNHTRNSAGLQEPKHRQQFHLRVYYVEQVGP